MVEGVAIIDPQTMRVHVEGYGDMTADVARELHAMRRARLDREAAVVQARQRLLARECGEATFFDGGCLAMQVDEAVYQHYVDRYGPKWWADKSNRKWIARRHPETVVKSRPANPTIRITETPAYRVIDKRSSEGSTP
jgi:hypothetical protein